jgi:hypothetical protein
MYEYSVNQPVVLYNPIHKHYIRVVFNSDGSMDCFKTKVFDETCILSLSEAIVPLNLLVSCKQFSEILQILKVSAIGGNYYVEHVKSTPQ